MGTFPWLFGSSAKSNRLAVTDPVLGDVTPSDTADWWEASVELGGEMIEFHIAGDVEPHASLMERARKLVSKWDGLSRRVYALMEERATELDDLPPNCSAEIRAQRIEAICLLTEERPRDGMVYFRRSGDGVMCWQCGVVDGKPCNVGADS